jgi:hypothetical protein
VKTIHTPPRKRLTLLLRIVYSIAFGVLSVNAAQAQNAGTHEKILVQVYNKDVDPAKATVLVNGGSIAYSAASKGWEAEVNQHSSISLKVDCPGFETVDIRFWPRRGNEWVANLAVRMGPIGSTYLRSGNNIQCIAPDTLRIGLMQQKVNAKLPLLDLLQNHGLEVVAIPEGSPNGQFPSQYPYLVLQHKDKTPFARKNDVAMAAISEAGYVPGIFLGRVDAGMSTLPIMIQFYKDIRPDEIDEFLDKNGWEKVYQNGNLVTANPVGTQVISLDMIPRLQKMLEAREVESAYFSGNYGIKLN